MNGFYFYFSFLIFDKKCHFLWTRSKSLKVMIAWVSNLTSLLLFSNSFTGIAGPMLGIWIQVFYGKQKLTLDSQTFVVPAYACDRLTWLLTLDSGINVGVRLLIFEKFWRQKKNQKWSQCLDWYKKVLKSWCENF